MGCGRHQQEIAGSRAEELSEFVPLGFFHLATKIGRGHAVRFVANDEVPIGRRFQLGLQIVGSRRHVEAKNEPIALPGAGQIRPDLARGIFRGAFKLIKLRRGLPMYTRETSSSRKHKRPKAIPGRKTRPLFGGRSFFPKPYALAARRSGPCSSAFLTAFGERLITVRRTRAAPSG